jgi:hypothetical protein
MDIIFIVNGENVPTSLDEDEPMWVWRNHALTESRNTGRPLEEWEIRNEAGAYISNWTTPADVGMKNYTRLFLTLKVGCGGDMMFAC